MSLETGVRLTKRHPFKDLNPDNSVPRIKIHKLCLPVYRKVSLTWLLWGNPSLPSISFFHFVLFFSSSPSPSSSYHTGTDSRTPTLSYPLPTVPRDPGVRHDRPHTVYLVDDKFGGLGVGPLPSVQLHKRYLLPVYGPRPRLHRAHVGYTHNPVGHGRIRSLDPVSQPSRRVDPEQFHRIKF